MNDTNTIYVDEAIRAFRSAAHKMCEQCRDRPTDIDECRTKNCLAIRLINHVDAMLNPADCPNDTKKSSS